MKITTWNINGIRSLKKNINVVLGELSTDIGCFQETKISRGQIPETTALVEGYSSYFSYPRKQSGYSGVATYCKESFTPEDAEEGFKSELLLSQENATLHSLAFLKEYAADMSEFDSEGRVVITHHLIKCCEEIRQLAIINVYCPRVDPEKPQRHAYKLQFCLLLEAQFQQLCKEGCSVVIVGDFNIAHSLIDHCDPGDEQEFNSSEARQWLKAFLSSKVLCGNKTITPVDAFRHLHPNETARYTCWNVKLGARLTNYGTRIDYILVSSDLLSALSGCDILSDYQGSDHCPVSLTLRCDPIPRKSVRLPPLCTRLWPEFSGQQQKLQAFFRKATCSENGQRPLANKSLEGTLTSAGVDNNVPEKRPLIQSKAKTGAKAKKQKSIMSFLKTNGCVQTKSSSPTKRNLDVCDYASNGTTSQDAKQNQEIHSITSRCRASLKDNEILDSGHEEVASPSKKRNIENAKAQCPTYSPVDDEFNPPPTVSEHAVPTSSLKGDRLSPLSALSEDVVPTSSPTGDELFHTVSEDAEDVLTPSQKDTSSLSTAWKTVLSGPPKPPLCSGHQKECVLRTVKKKGLNCGRSFFACAQPTGHASNPDANCNFFKWVNPPKKSVF